MSSVPQVQASDHASPADSQGNLTGSIHSEGKTVAPIFKYTSKQYESLASQFNTYVTVSIFAVAAVVAIISFARDTIDPEKGDLSSTVRQFEIGKLLCMIVIGLHFGVIIVGGRAWALCFRLVADCDAHPEKEPLDLEAANVEPVDPNFDSNWDHIALYRQVPFYRYVAYCERAQLIGTLLLLVSMLLMQFSLFSEKVLPWVFLGVAIVLVFSIYLTGFWDVSVTRANIMGLFTRFLGEVRRQGQTGARTGTTVGVGAFRS